MSVAGPKEAAVVRRAGGRRVGGDGARDSAIAGV